MVLPTLSIAYSTDSFHLTITPIYDCLSYPLSKMAAGYSSRIVAPIAKHMTGADVTIASPFCPRSQSSPLCTSHLSVSSVGSLSSSSFMGWPSVWPITSEQNHQRRSRTLLSLLLRGHLLHPRMCSNRHHLNRHIVLIQTMILTLIWNSLILIRSRLAFMKRLTTT